MTFECRRRLESIRLFPCRTWHPEQINASWFRFCQPIISAMIRAPYFPNRCSVECWVLVVNSSFILLCMFPSANPIRNPNKHVLKLFIIFNSPRFLWYKEILCWAEKCNVFKTIVSWQCTWFLQKKNTMMRGTLNTVYWYLEMISLWNDRKEKFIHILKICMGTYSFEQKIFNIHNKHFEYFIHISQHPKATVSNIQRTLTKYLSV